MADEIRFPPSVGPMTYALSLSETVGHVATAFIFMQGIIVKTYNVATGHLILEHNYPRCKPTQEPPSIPVDVNAVLGTVTADELRVGAWVNVLGYVRREESSVYVEAVMVFRAGAIAVGEYERILHNSLEVDRRVQRPK